MARKRLYSRAFPVVTEGCPTRECGLRGFDPIGSRAADFPEEFRICMSDLGRAQGELMTALPPLPPCIATFTAAQIFAVLIVM